MSGRDCLHKEQAEAVFRSYLYFDFIVLFFICMIIFTL